jgi:hypothetical protein
LFHTPFNIFLKFEFFFKKKPTYLKFWKNHQSCSLSWPHTRKVSFWDLNAENYVQLTWNDPYALRLTQCLFLSTLSIPELGESSASERNSDRWQRWWYFLPSVLSEICTFDEHPYTCWLYNLITYVCNFPSLLHRACWRLS